MHSSCVFKKADELLRSRSKLFHEKEVHVVSFKWIDYSPELKVYDGDNISELDLGILNINVSKEKTCVGTLQDDYAPCPNGATVSIFSQCQRCASTWIPRLECIFEPSGCESCSSDFCEKEHSVYLAFLGKYPKIGMTRKARLKQRLIEQGADAYALLATVDHRLKAREEERTLSNMLNIPQRVGHKKKLAQMARKLDRTGMQTTYRGIKNRTAVGELRYLRDYPIRKPLRNAPRLRPTAGIHRGKMVGLKGRFLIYESSGLQAIDLSDLPGRKLRIRS